MQYFYPHPSLFSISFKPQQHNFFVMEMWGNKVYPNFHPFKYHSYRWIFLKKWSGVQQLSLVQFQIALYPRKNNLFKKVNIDVYWHFHMLKRQATFTFKIQTNKALVSSAVSMTSVETSKHPPSVWMGLSPKHACCFIQSEPQRKNAMAEFNLELCQTSFQVMTGR